MLWVCLFLLVCEFVLKLIRFWGVFDYGGVGYVIGCTVFLVGVLLSVYVFAFKFASWVGLPDFLFAL